MIEISHLEWHITHNCNFSCEGCTHFTNHGHDWFIDIDTLKKWYSQWNKRISPQTMAILGGEPLLHKDIIHIIYLTKEMWVQPLSSNVEYPFPKYEIVTNGVLLDEKKHKNLPKALADTDCTLSISIHQDANINFEYDKKLKKCFSIVKKWKKEYNIKVNIYDSFNSWIRAYKDFGINSEPFNDNDIEKSWNNCPTGKNCFQLHNENIYKCSLTAYLQLQKNKYGPLFSEKWDPYLKYVPLKPNCSDEDIIKFFNKTAEPVCAMCPSNPKIFKKNNPLIPTSYYEKYNKFKLTYL